MKSAFAAMLRAGNAYTNGRRSQRDRQLSKLDNHKLGGDDDIWKLLKLIIWP